MCGLDFVGHEVGVPFEMSAGLCGIVPDVGFDGARFWV